MVNGKVPLVRPAVIVKVVAPEVTTEDGAKLAAASPGNPLTLNVTVPANPPDRATVIW